MQLIIKYHLQPLSRNQRFRQHHLQSLSRNQRFRKVLHKVFLQISFRDLRSTIKRKSSQWEDQKTISVNASVSGNTTPSRSGCRMDAEHILTPDTNTFHLDHRNYNLDYTIIICGKRQQRTDTRCDSQNKMSRLIHKTKCLPFV
jgi:hypothetical protein